MPTLVFNLSCMPHASHLPNFSKELNIFLEVLHCIRTATWEQKKQNLAVCSCCELKVIHSLKWSSMWSLRRVIRRQEDFILRVVYWLMFQQAISAFGRFTSRHAEAGVAWWVPRLRPGTPLKWAEKFYFHNHTSFYSPNVVKRPCLIFVVLFIGKTLP